MAALSIDALLAPVSSTAPCGDNLEYDPVFHALGEAARGKAEQQFGDTIIAGVEPDWRVMQELSLALLQRTRDLRVAMHLLRAATRLSGFGGFSSGIRLVRGLLEQHWDGVFPLLDATDNNDPTMRLSALAPLADDACVLADLRGAVIGNPREGMSARQVELGLRKAEPTRHEIVPTEAGVKEALAAATQQFPGLLDELLAAPEHMKAIEALIDAQVGVTRGPDLRPLRLLTQHLAQAARMATGQAEPAPEHDGTQAATPNAGMAAGKPSGSGAINTRADAIKTLDRVCEWIALNEPTNPAPLLIRRAQRLMTKSFMDIIRDLAPEGVKDVERIAGLESE